MKMKKKKDIASLKRKKKIHQYEKKANLYESFG